MLHQDGSRRGLAGRAADARPDRHDGRRDEHDLLGVPGRGGRHGLDVSGAARGVRGARPAVRASTPIAAATTSTRRRPARRWTRSSSTQVGRALDRLGHRAHPGLFAGGARTLGADVRHAAGPAGRRSSSLPASATSQRPTGSSARSICRRTTLASPSRRRSPRAPSWPSRSGHARRDRCASRRSGSWPRQHRGLWRAAAAAAARAACAPTTSRRASRCANIRTAPLAIFHGPRRIGRYDARGLEIAAPTRSSLAPCSTPSRRGLEAPRLRPPPARRPALTASRHGATASHGSGRRNGLPGRTKKLMSASSRQIRATRTPSPAKPGRSVHRFPTSPASLN